MDCPRSEQTKRLEERLERWQGATEYLNDAESLLTASRLADGVQHAAAMLRRLCDDVDGAAARVAFALDDVSTAIDDHLRD